MKQQTLVYLYLTVTTSAWGSLYVASKVALTQVPPATLLFLRFVLGGAALLLALLQRRPQPIAREDRKYILFIGFFGYFASAGAQLLGTKLANASLASMINAMNPVSIIMFASLILKERFTANKAIAVTAAVAGTYVIMGGASAGGQTLGIMLSILSVLTWSLTTVVARRISQKYDPLLITTYGMIIAAVCALPPALYELAAGGGGHLLSAKAIGSVLYIGLTCTALAHWLWNRSLSIIDAGTCSLFYPLQPLVATLLGWLMLGERISVSFAMGAVLIVGGVLVGMLGRPKARPA